MGGGRIQGKIVLRKSVLIFLTVFADGFGPPWRVDLEPGMEGGRIQGKIVLRKSELTFLMVFADGFGPPRASGFGARDGRGSDPGENSLRIPSRSAGKTTPRSPQVLGSTPRGVLVDMRCRYSEPTGPFSQLLALQATINSCSQFLQDIPVTKGKECSCLPQETTTALTPRAPRQPKS